MQVKGGECCDCLFLLPVLVFDFKHCKSGWFSQNLVRACAPDICWKSCLLCVLSRKNMMSMFLFALNADVPRPLRFSWQVEWLTGSDFFVLWKQKMSVHHFCNPGKNLWILLQYFVISVWMVEPRPRSACCCCWSLSSRHVTKATSKNNQMGFNFHNPHYYTFAHSPLFIGWGLDLMILTSYKYLFRCHHYFSLALPTTEHIVLRRETHLRIILSLWSIKMFIH